jgi:hypothetical protein
MNSNVPGLRIGAKGKLQRSILNFVQMALGMNARKILNSDFFLVQAFFLLQHAVFNTFLRHRPLGRFSCLGPFLRVCLLSS